MSPVLAMHVGDEMLFDLAHGLLDGGHAKSALQHVRACPHCESRFRETVRDRERARIAGAPASEAGMTPILAWSGAAAAVLAVASILTFWHRAPAMVADWLPTNATEVFLRDATLPSNQTEVLRAVEAYRAHDAAAVVALLDGRDLPASCDPVKLLLASALVHEGKDESALQVLDRLEVPSLPQPARDRALWTRAAALDHAGHRGDANAVLRDLASRQGEFQDRAANLLASR